MDLHSLKYTYIHTYIHIQWDRIDVGDPSMTVDGLIAMLSEQYGVELSMLSSGVTILFSDFLDRKKMKVCMYVCM